MKILENEKLEKYTTFRMGGIAKKMYIPESVEELINLYNNNNKIKKYVLAGGSNIIINDKKTFDEVLNTREFNKTIEKKSDGVYYVGASVRLQTLIRKINDDSYGGIEDLYSIPATVGGAIYMNAGSKKKTHNYIGDYIEKVQYLENGRIIEYNKEECGFSHRTSAFQNKEGIIIGAILNFKKVNANESKYKIKKRLESCKKNHDMSLPNCGSTFKIYNKYIMTIVQKISYGKKGGSHFSKKTKNWLLHGQNGDFKQTISLLNRIKKIHKFLRKKCELEIIIWN
jgi:UDP-N-acetylmuramate dehydrogenase